MLSNDILRSVRYILKANNNDLVRILALGNVEATAEQIAVWLRKEDEEGFQRCPDIVLSSFLNGLIYEKRGKDESAPALEPERRINNNIVLKKLRIAFSLKTDDILAILTEQQFRVSMPEITAMMRAPDRSPGVLLCSSDIPCFTVWQCTFGSCFSTALFHFFINQVFSCQHQSQANKCTWWQHRQQERGVGVENLHA